MSHITVERFRDDRRKQKAPIEQALYQNVYMDVVPSQRQAGLPIVSVTGPNLPFHVRNAEKLLGRWQKLHAVEHNEKIFKAIERAHDQMGGPKNVQLYHGDVFDVARYVARRTRSQRIFFDFDLCRTFSCLAKEGLCQELRRLRTVCCNNDHLSYIWLILTFSLRKEKLTPREIDNRIIRAWWCNLERIIGTTYKDGTGMYTVLFRG